MPYDSVNVAMPQPLTKTTLDPNTAARLADLKLQSWGADLAETGNMLRIELRRREECLQEIDDLMRHLESMRDTLIEQCKVLDASGSQLTEMAQRVAPHTR